MSILVARSRAFPVLLASLGVAACAAVDHGRINAHGEAAKVDWSIAPTACLSGTAVVPAIDAVVLTSEVGTPSAIKIIRDPGSGLILQFLRLVGGIAEVRTFNPAQCVALDLESRSTGWRINGVTQMKVAAHVDCTAEGVNVVGNLSFGSCGYSSKAAKVLHALSTAPSKTDNERLAGLPHVPEQVDIPPPPPVLWGLRYRVQPHLDGAPAGNGTLAEAEQSCTKTGEGVLDRMGWKAVRDPQAAVDLVAEVRCSGHVSYSEHGSTLEIVLPSADEPALILSHDGAVIERVAKGPGDLLCDSNEPTPDARFKSCMTRLGRMAALRVFTALTASQALADLAKGRASH